MADNYLEAWVESLQSYDDDSSRRLDVPATDPALEMLRAAMNQCLEQGQKRSDAHHTSSMELAMGLSDCFMVLTEVRQGRLDVSVSDATLNSPEELVRQLGMALNEAVQGLRDVQEITERQQATIRELSTPVLKVWDGTIVLPIIGVLDTRRAMDIMEKVLHSIAEQSARHVILDLTGVDTVDTRTADHLLKVMRARQLLGANCLLSGIQPAVAQTLVEIGVDLSSVRTMRNLQASLRACLRELQEAK